MRRSIAALIAVLLLGCTSAPYLPDVATIATESTIGTAFVLREGQLVTAAHVIQKDVASPILVMYTSTFLDAPYQTLGEVLYLDLAEDVAVLEVGTTAGRATPVVCDATIGDELIVLSVRNDRRRRMAVVTVTDQLGRWLYAEGHTAMPGDSGSPVIKAGSGCVAGIVQATADNIIRIGQLKGVAR